MAYSAYEISLDSRKAVLDRFPPSFSDVICHHVTERFGLPRKERVLPPPAGIIVVGYACDRFQEALVVTVNGTTRRPDGMVYHITLSLERSKGRKPVDSNALIASLGWIGVEPLPIETIPRIY